MQNQKPRVQKFVHEIFEDISKANTQKDAAEKLKQYSRELSQNEMRVINGIIKGALDRTIVWLIPTGAPPYTACEEHNIPVNIYKEFPKRILWFMEGNKKIENRVKRESLYIRFLETIHPKDAQIIIDMVGKEINYKHLTPTVVRLAYGDNFFTEDKQKAKTQAA